MAHGEQRAREQGVGPGYITSKPPPLSAARFLLLKVSESPPNTHNWRPTPLVRFSLKSPKSSSYVAYKCLDMKVMKVNHSKNRAPRKHEKSIF